MGSAKFKQSFLSLTFVPEILFVKINAETFLNKCFN